MKIFIMTFSLVVHWNRRSIINIKEFLTTSPKVFPLVLALLCGNCPLTFNLFVFFIFSRLLLVSQFFVVNIS